MKSEETVEYALESDIAFSTTNESEDISFFMDLADDELMLQAVLVAVNSFAETMNKKGHSLSLAFF
ncbi:hypothetical protein LRQ11_12405 [Pseudomonas sp. MAFF 311095]|uniref:hypothetical protein n=1 Tax=Pseudomonas petroselini TaxID=2899822 RepID=UPI0020B26B96|nr:hypothetical protein [Pseudomonas petroselini]MCD7079609.1 hypothetical protein [Pseudomonas petroselini]